MTPTLGYPLFRGFMQELSTADFFEALEETLEWPVKEAVLYFISRGEWTASSGFHHFHNPPAWGIVFIDIPSDELMDGARRVGLEVRMRSHVKTRTTSTDIYLLGVSEFEPRKAKDVFDRLVADYKINGLMREDQ